MSFEHEERMSRYLNELRPMLKNWESVRECLRSINPQMSDDYINESIYPVWFKYCSPEGDVETQAAHNREGMLERHAAGTMLNLAINTWRVK